MTRVLQSLIEVAANYDAVVLDQWGVLHDGTSPYSGAVAAIEALAARGVQMAVLSNSGKRAAPNLTRIADIGFPANAFADIMTSGEALWRDVQRGRIAASRFFPIERNAGDAASWAEGLTMELVDQDHAEAVLLMGLPDGSELADWKGTLARFFEKELTVYCSNPDLASPRDGGRTVMSPGALARAYENLGGRVVYYGKPHRPVFQALEVALKTKRLLMVGDSLDHDIAGASNAGWDSALVQGGLYAARFSEAPSEAVLAQLCKEHAVTPPTYRMDVLS